MAKECKNFTFLGKSLSELSAAYISVDFDQEKERDFALSRTIEYSNTTTARSEPSVRRAGFENHLTFEVHLVKDPCRYPTQEERIITESELREFTRWLTSTDSSQFLRFTYDKEHEDDTSLYLGQFTDIQPFLAGGELYGLRLIFECSTCFGYTEELSVPIHCKGSTMVTIPNHSDDTNRFRYPKLDIVPYQTGQIYLANLSDCQIYESGTLAEFADNTAGMTLLQDKIEAYALAHGLSVEYRPDPVNTEKIVTLGDNTAIQFRFTDNKGTAEKCAAFYRTATRSYTILKGGFLYLNVHKDLPIHMDCEKVTLFDDIGRMITYESIGMTDMDYFYWPRLRSGDNLFLFYAPDCTFTLTHRELRKAGA